MPTTSAAIPPESEKQYMASIVKLARTLGWRVHHQYDARRSEPGVPDLLMVHPSRYRLIFAEIKSARGKTTADQEFWIAALSAYGAETYLWRAGTDSLASIAEILKGGNGV